MALDHEQPAALDGLAAAFLHGDGRSRWFDKTLHFIVTPGGEAAINMEHSVTDGSIMSTLAAHLTFQKEELSSVSGEDASPSFQEMSPVLSWEIRKLLRDAADAYDELCSKTPLKTLVFKDFGKDVIKSLKVSPDGFVQMGLQLARYRTFGHFCNSYEPVMTRNFLHGRTEAIRTVSPQSCRFVALMEEKACSNEDRAAALREAVEEHAARAKLCRRGEGVDRHLYGLLQIYRQKGDSLEIKGLPPLFLSPGWQLLLRNVLSTSTSAPKGLQLAGFGPVVEEGFGVRYLIFSEKMHFCLSSRVHLEGSLERFREELLRAYREMRDLLQKSAQGE
jgi:carnitine O-acetyltransferase